jgi:hypothetical protein
VSDIFREVDEEVRREQLKKLWDKWGNYAIAVALVIVMGVAGWRGWDWYQARKAAEAGAAFDAAAALAEAGKHEEAENAFARIAADSTAGYRILARFRDAAELAKRDRPAAVKAFDAIAADGGIPPPMRELATVRAALLLVNTAKFDEIRSRLEPLTGSERPFRHTARELSAISAWHNGDVAAARRYFDMMANDPETPAGTRARVEVLLALDQSQSKS